MTLRILISLSVLLLAWQNVSAQLAPAVDFFNSGAQFYISNNIPSALEKVEGGLKIYPDDVKLKKLEELLKQQQQSQSSQSQQNQQNQSQQQQSQNNQQSQQQNSSSQQNQQSSQKNSQEQQKQESKDQAGQKKDEQEKQQEQQKASAEKKDGQEKQNEQGQPVSAGQMTPEEAKRLLDAQKGNEQVLQLKPQGKPENQNRPIKDW
jgi:Ca-activated chloride channel family protein